MTARARDREYDRFGPWALEINDEDPPPRLFAPYLAGAGTPLLSVKIPRRIARREASPGMDLYDFVVILGERRMHILERCDHDVREHILSYAEIRHIAVHEELLRGRLHLAGERGAYSLPYNAVSSELMGRVTAVIRARLGDQGSGVAVPLPMAAEPAELGFYLDRLLREQSAADPSLRALASQATVPLGIAERGRLRRVVLGLVEKRLLESLHLSDGRELRVLDRGRSFAYRWQAVYGHRETIIPLANITRVAWQAATGRQPFGTLTVSTAGGDSSWAFAAAHTAVDPYRAWLEGVEASRR